MPAVADRVFRMSALRLILTGYEDICFSYGHLLVQMGQYSYRESLTSGFCPFRHDLHRRDPKTIFFSKTRKEFLTVFIRPLQSVLHACSRYTRRYGTGAGRHIHDHKIICIHLYIYKHSFPYTHYIIWNLKPQDKSNICSIYDGISSADFSDVHTGRTDRICTCQRSPALRYFARKRTILRSDPSGKMTAGYGSSNIPYMEIKTC